MLGGKVGYKYVYNDDRGTCPSREKSRRVYEDEKQLPLANTTMVSIISDSN